MSDISLDRLDERLTSWFRVLDGKLGELTVRVGLQNGRVSTLENKLEMHLQEISSRQAWERLTKLEQLVDQVNDFLQEAKIRQEAKAELRSQDKAIIVSLVAVSNGIAALLVFRPWEVLF